MILRRPFTSPDSDQGLLRIVAGLILVSLTLLVLWNVTDPLPPAWDEAQHLLQGQAFGRHLHRFSGSALWWQQFFHLNQRYPPLTYWLALPFSIGHPLTRADGQLLNLLVLAALAGITHRIATHTWRSATAGWLAVGILVIYPAITGFAHLYMIELLLVTTVALNLWAALSYWQKPSWPRAVAVGCTVGLVLLTKWTGILFLVFPLLICAWRAWQTHQWRGVLHGILATTLLLLVSWPWYSANWLFVITNGLTYGATAHYYITCPQGSFCWWTTYLRVLPAQMTPLLCWLPLLVLLPLPRSWQRHPSGFAPCGWFPLLGWWRHTALGQGGALIALTWMSGTLLYTFVAIKDGRFTVPLLPLLAVLSAGGIYHWLQSWGRPRWGGGFLAFGGSLALIWSGQPQAPGVAPLWQGVNMQLQGHHPTRAIQEWLHTQAQPRDWLQTTIGVIPNREVLSSETLTYLAKVQNLPLAFRPTGQSPWPELELYQLDRHLTVLGDWGKIGPYGPNKQTIVELLKQKPDWQVDPPVVIPDIDTLQLYRPSQSAVRVEPLAIAPPAVALTRVEAVACLSGAKPCDPDRSGVPSWELEWVGSSAQLAQTTGVAELVDETGTVQFRSAFAVAQGRLRTDQPGSVQIHQILSLFPPQALPDPTDHLRLIWQAPDQPPQTEIIKGIDSTKLNSTPRDTSISFKDPLFPIQQAAKAASEGDLEKLAAYLSVWTTLPYTNFLTDPSRSGPRRLVLAQLAAAQDSLEEQIQLHYQLGLMAAVQLEAEAAQTEFEQITQLQPNNPWGWAYLALLKLLFTHSIGGMADLKQQLRYLTTPVCTPDAVAADPTLGSVCQRLQQWAGR